MKYFELCMDPDITNPIKITGIDGSIYKNAATAEEFEKIPALTVGYFDHTPQTEIYDLLERPAFMVSDQLKRLFALYEPDMQFRGVRVYANDLEDNTAPLYWLPYVPYLDCLGDRTKKYTTGMLEELVLDEKKITGAEIFRVADILENKVMISTAVAESMIRRSMTGFSLKPVQFQ